MKLREEEFYEQYHQHGGTTIIPTEIFNELYDDATEEIERLNNIINKAIEDIEEKVGDEIHDMMYVIDVSDVLDILKGVDRE